MCETVRMRSMYVGESMSGCEIESVCESVCVRICVCECGRVCVKYFEIKIV